jgi:hypothetical protein
MGIRQVESKIAFRLGAKRNFWAQRRYHSKLRFRLRVAQYAIKRFGSERVESLTLLRLSIATVRLHAARDPQQR